MSSLRVQSTHPGIASSAHCRPDFMPWEQRATCCHCAAPLADNQVVKTAYTANTVNGWAKVQLGILADMAEDRGIGWFASEARKVAEALVLLTDRLDNHDSCGGRCT